MGRKVDWRMGGQVLVEIKETVNDVETEGWQWKQKRKHEETPVSIIWRKEEL